VIGAATVVGVPVGAAKVVLGVPVEVFVPLKLGTLGAGAEETVLAKSMAVAAISVEAYIMLVFEGNQDRSEENY